MDPESAYWLKSGRVRIRANSLPHKLWPDWVPRSLSSARSETSWRHDEGIAVSAAIRTIDVQDIVVIRAVGQSCWSGGPGLSYWRGPTAIRRAQAWGSLEHAHDDRRKSYRPCARDGEVVPDMVKRDRGGISLLRLEPHGLSVGLQTIGYTASKAGGFKPPCRWRNDCT